MPDVLCISVRFLQPYAHGRADQGQPEWPPSPLRLYQAIVNAVAAQGNERRQLTHKRPSLKWLEQQPPPTIVAPQGIPSATPYRLYVPDNVADLVARSWRRGNTAASIADYRVDKDVRPIRLSHDAVHYLYPLSHDGCPYLEVLKSAARSITHLGWGVDMVVGNAAILTEEDVAKLPGQRWRPTSDGVGTSLRVPKPGTLQALIAKHEAFLHRLGPDGFRPVPPLTAFDTIGYRLETDIPSRPRVAFSLLKLDASGYRAFDTPRRCRDVAAWVRHAVSTVCEGWPFGDTAAFVHGHAPAGGPLQDGPRFSYLPLPSIESRGGRGEHVGAIRRVLITAPPGFQDRVDWIRRRLPNTELVQDNSAPVALLNLLPASDWVLQRYIEPAAAWTTVTPVVLPGHDDHNLDKAQALLWKAFQHAGFSDQLLKETYVDFRKVGFLPGVDLADRYALPETPKVKGPRYHVRVVFPHAITGPLAIGALRYRGLGLFVGVT